MMVLICGTLRGGIWCRREIKRATHSFTALVGQGAFGPVYKAILQPSGTILAVKVLSSHSKQGEKEFQNEV